MFTSSNYLDFSSIDHLFPTIITNDNNVDLCKIFDEQEIKISLWSIYNLQSPGPDGITMSFYKKTLANIQD